MSLTCQSNFGPFLGHSLRRPLSCEIPFRRGPRHWGQSAAPAVRQDMPRLMGIRNKHRALMLHLRAARTGTMQIYHFAVTWLRRPGRKSGRPGSHRLQYSSNAFLTGGLEGAMYTDRRHFIRLGFGGAMAGLLSLAA